MSVPFEVLKNSGEKQAFSKEKLARSLTHTCLFPHACEEIADEVIKDISPTPTTNEIFEKTASILKRKSKLAAIQYSLKRSLFDLGPEGHNFETFVARYFEKLNYITFECVTVQGQFVKHEIDVMATRQKERLFVKCKFHNRLGIKNDIKVVLYVKSRWDDVKAGPDGKRLTDFYLASNTSFTEDALVYAKGTGVKLLGVNAPEGESFLSQLMSLKLYPVTSLTKIDKTIKKVIIEKKIILAQDLLEHKELLTHLGCSEHQISEICEEICFLTKESCENKIWGCD